MGLHSFFPLPLSPAELLGGVTRQCQNWPMQLVSCGFHQSGTVEEWSRFIDVKKMSASRRWCTALSCFAMSLLERRSPMASCHPLSNVVGANRGSSKLCVATTITRTCARPNTSLRRGTSPSAPRGTRPRRGERIRNHAPQWSAICATTPQQPSP